MAYFVTGGTGLIGRHLISELLANRRGKIYVLVRPESSSRLDRLHRTEWRSSKRIVPVLGDLTAARLGVDNDTAASIGASVRHVFHLAALYDMTATAEQNELLNVGGTAGVLALAGTWPGAVLHQVSSVAVSGDYVGVFDETMFDEGQRLPSPYHATKFEAERLVRDQTEVPWRIYRPALVVGHSVTGAMDKVDGPYYFFPALKMLRDSLPQWLPLIGVDLGDTNIVPVDFVAQAIDHLAHVPGLDSETFHLVNPTPQGTIDVVNTLAGAAKAARFSVPVDRRVTSLLPPALTPINLITAALRTPTAQRVLDETLGRLGIPGEVLGHLGFASTFASMHTENALVGSGISCPALETYSPALWDYWEQHLDPATAQDAELRVCLTGAKVVITGASSGIGRAAALKTAQAGGLPILVARGKEGLLDVQAEIEALGGSATCYPCDLSDLQAVDRLAKRITADHPTIDVVVNNAGRSIRRSLHLSTDRFHDFERTMQLNYFGAIRLVMGLLPAMRAAGAGHVVNISSIGVQTNPPRFSAYVASKAALDAWSRVVSSELIGDGVTFTTIHMPLVRTPMIAPTKIYETFPTITPAQAADLVMDAIKGQPHEINTRLGTAGEVAHALLPKTSFQVLHHAFHVFPDSAAAHGDGSDPEPTAQQRLLARILKGVHW
ncbi:MAG: SDR family oxidoreductase [Nocardioidaceae bacterium]